MYSANIQDVRVPAIIDSFERTSTPVSNDLLLQMQRQWGPSFEQSPYLHSQNVFDLLGDRIERLRDTPNNWNSYDSPSPSSVSIKNALPILRALRAKLLQPDRVLPSAEGGVSFTFVSDTVSRAAIEALNDGEAYVLLYDLNGNSETVDWSTEPNVQLDLIERLALHLRSDGIALKG